MGAPELGKDLGGRALAGEDRQEKALGEPGILQHRSEDPRLRILTKTREDARPGGTSERDLLAHGQSRQPVPEMPIRSLSDLGPDPGVTPHAHQIAPEEPRHKAQGRDLGSPRVHCQVPAQLVGAEERLQAEDDLDRLRGNERIA